MDVEEDGSQVHVEPAFDARGFSVWTLDGEPCQVVNVKGQLCLVNAQTKPVEGQELLQQQIITASFDIHAEFAKH